MDALALGADEGRGKQRYAAVSRKQTMTRRSPNGEIRWRNTPSSHAESNRRGRGTARTETSK